ncbi:MAG: hypothetical protein IPO98_18255 [Saprospiraceae bacterium]|nr:hypothetical protein [Saprospiraceae bacterium]
MKQSLEGLSNLMDCFFDGDIRLCQSANGLLVGDIGENTRNILLPYLKPMMENISNPKHIMQFCGILWWSWQYLVSFRKNFKV